MAVGIDVGHVTDLGAPPAPDVCFDTDPGQYRHWNLRLDGEVAWLVLDVSEDGGLIPGYELKLNSYDLGVDIELYDATQRLRFEHPEVKTVILTSGKEKVFCAGANIGMLAASTHEWKVNFCKFTNETRNGIEDATEHSGQTYLAAVNGSCAGGGYELALACDHILLVDDNSSAVSLPEVPLLGVLPGTGGLIRVVDKRWVRKDLADVFATRSDGVRGKTAAQWGLVDELATPRQFDDAVRRRATELAARSQRPSDVHGVELVALKRQVGSDSISYDYVSATIDRKNSTATITLHAPARPAPADFDEAAGQGAAFWPLALTRQLDDLILRLRTNETKIGIWLLQTQGDMATVDGYERLLLENAEGHCLANEIVLYYKRVCKRLDVTSRSLIALIEPGSAYTGMLTELALACDRQYILDGPPLDDENSELRASLRLTAANFGAFPMGNGLSRLESRFYGHRDHLTLLRDKEMGIELTAGRAADLGLVTAAPDDIDWQDEIRVVVEGRAALSPDACTGMEANHRFVGPETVETKIFGRLSAWQNWIFLRPNASGPEGALRRYGTGKSANFDTKRV
ncbi:2,3-epoxybenzoyl-CoA dihydrolase [Mycobacterium montefiorense]|uniref:Enoyl-CoA hydratase n=1 Tax=Mycobacterium montefiorense TaxID=154654 RepID=A0AA37UW91_9MYCO|nr:2,3-epoxybenzoyl-CoA dihydrolase [Mycobacterium montefiorense]GBG40028.1 enoyl-CoA hydratase [Mycobacterium montefiorense]GKU33612.1 enoyl-CoA hydratase [Mycobacterium montefiorense]GKU39549.1 enoyl-CoA hydratase [Mycobacterium montefiorense]GKU43826.1 enoyl-CoA hydratase [Mycobacterium montefiorense]GKU52682.1 enoyl-CoA hydratase [Mycobacterium montefiorense]